MALGQTPMVVRYLSHKTAFFVEALLAFLLVIALLFAVTGFVKARNAQVSVNQVEAARIAEARAKVYSDEAACKAGIPNLKRINRFLIELKADYLDRAFASAQLALLPDTHTDERILRLSTAKLYRQKAKHVPTFPVRSLADCAADRDAALERIGRGGPS